ASYATAAYPNVSYTPEQITSLALLYTDLGAYVSTNQATWVTSGGISSDWDNYISTLTLMGLDKFLKIEYDAFFTYTKSASKKS
ncbi:MAG: sugar ABC transporter substrate-binding protein, partial [Treponema sp.]|nr:sugar ABC transporter substrate-binding protein [Treponema sp.]